MSVAAICLALVIYHEARGEPIEGKLLVAETVLTRMEKGAYPDSVCGVVGQANQYAITAVDSLAPAEHRAWVEALLVSEAILEDPEGTLPGLGASHFHTPAVAPRWSREMTPLGLFGNHLFFAEKSND